MGTNSELFKVEISDNDYTAMCKVIDNLIIKNVTDEQEPPALFSINGVEVLPLQSFALVTAEKKGGKSNMAGILMAAGISKDKQVLGGAVKRIQEEPLSIVVVDTEQPKKDARRTYRRVMRAAGYEGQEWNEKGITPISIRTLEQKQRQRAVAVALRKYNPNMIILDGIADLMDSINDEQTSTSIIEWLATIAEEHNCLVVGMLHLNHGSDKIGGWAGRIAGQKYTDSFYIHKERDKGFFTVKHEGRGESAPDLKFRIVSNPNDKIGYWEVVGLDACIPEITAEDQERDKLQELIEAAPLPCSNVQLVQFLTQHSGKSRSWCFRGLRKCKEWKMLASRKEGNRSIWYIPKNDCEEIEQVKLPYADD